METGYFGFSKNILLNFMKDFLLKYKEYIVLAFLVLSFFFLRFPAVDFPYHQDEYKWPLYAYNIGYEPGAVPHPPLTEFIYKMTGKIFDPFGFRFTPLIFSVANLLLLYLYVRRKFGKTAAIWVASFFTLSFYGLLASLTVDTDGAILPFFLLLSLIFYDLFYESSNKNKFIWLGLMLVSIILGLLVKISFILGVVAIVLDFIIRERKKITKKYLINFGLFIAGFVALFSIVLLVSKFIFPGFSLDRAFAYWDTFMKSFFDRNFFQTGIQFAKALLYASPFFIFIGLSSLYPYRKDFALYHIFIAIGLVFYLFAFDFSIGALDRYFAFLVVPLCIIAGVLASENIKNINALKKPYIVILAVIIFAISLLQKLPQYVPPLHPKAEWIDRIISFKWDFLYPFSGGSGPAGFYISFMFIGLCWILGTILFVWYLKSSSSFRSTIFAMFLLLGFSYNTVFIEEYLLGSNNGSTPKLTMQALDFIENNPDIKNVFVYNDTGGFNIKMMDKYFRRMYAVPAFEEEYKGIFSEFSGHLLYVNIPRVYDGLYLEYIKSCDVIYSETDKYITTQVLDCRK